MSIANDFSRETVMRTFFEASLPLRIERASRIKLQHFIPAYWFSAAASECALMFISGHFYGAISMAQTYVEALSRFLADHHEIGVGTNTVERCRELARRLIISKSSLDAACSVLERRNDFHHLNKSVPGEEQVLQQMAETCINHLHTIESEVFSYSISSGELIIHKPGYWPDSSPGMTMVQVRNLY